MKKPVWLTRQTVLTSGIAGALALAIVVLLIQYRPAWTGFWADSMTTVERDSTGTITKTVEAPHLDKTLWDWLSVLGVPLTLFLLGFWLQQQQQVRAKQQEKLDKETAEGNQREEVLQAYFDRLSTLLIDAKLNNLDKIQQDISIPIEQKELLDSSVDVIRARTLKWNRKTGQGVKL